MLYLLFIFTVNFILWELPMYESSLENLQAAKTKAFFHAQAPTVMLEVSPIKLF
jgi:hypothetical protein